MILGTDKVQRTLKCDSSVLSCKKLTCVQMINCVTLNVVCSTYTFFIFNNSIINND